MAWRDPWENVDRSNALRMQSDAQGINMLSALQGAQTNALQQRQLTGNMEEQARVRDRTRQIEQAMIGAGGDLEKAIPAITQFAPMDALKMRQDYEKQKLEADGKRATISKDRATALKSVYDISKQSFGSVMQNPTQESALAALGQVQATLKSLNLPGDVTAEVERVRSFKTPDEIKQWAAGQALSADKLLPTFQTRNNGGTTDTLSINPVSGAVSVANSIKNTVSPDAVLSAETARRGQNMTEGASLRADARARDMGRIPPGYRLAADGQSLEAIPGGPAAMGKALPTPAVTSLAAAGTAVEDTKRLAGSFQDKFGNKTILGDMSNTFKRIAGDETGQAQWWQDMDALQNQTRNALFGSALTKTELAAWEKTSITPRMDAKQIKENLARRAEIEARAASKLSRGYEAAGYNKDQIRELMGIGAQYLDNPAPPTTARQSTATNETKVIGGVTYVKRDGKWYAQ